MTVLAFSIVAATVLISAFVQGSTGMGFAMIVAPVVSFIDPTLIPVMLLVLMIPLNAYVAARERSAIDWHGVKWISVGRFAGTFAGLWILLIVNLHQLSLLIGWSTLIAAVAALLAPKFSPNRTA
ncbi:sulfite exporter TauE/SafE family protein, partial [Burkholderia multivorans]